MSTKNTAMNELRKFVRQIVNESVGGNKFKIPEQIKSLYKTSGDFSNVRNWKARIVVGNSMGREEKKIGDWDNVGYVLISLTTNYIIPVARCDEHHTGYDLLYDLSEKYKIKDLDYQSIFLLGNHYVYGGEYHKKEVMAIKRAYEYGARDIIIKEMNGDNKSLNIEDYVANEGNFDQAVKAGKKLKRVSKEGQKFIDELKNIIHLFEQYKINPLKQNSKFEENIINYCKNLERIVFSNDVLWKTLRNSDVSRKSYKSFEDAIESENIRAIDDSLFGMGGIKNTIHVLLKKNDKKLEEFFWSNENALEQFNAMSNINATS